eukprot:gb/GFBE01056459.1/.p1 GENE.gb/GFBE01056459.1/~~gb/GFBE01056459.1/.p1  ORF type:complete len:299 (+),score=50.51 gb/GFBE01056459.1/:1-897(+)
MAGFVWPAAPACAAPAFPAPIFTQAPPVPPPAMAPVLPPGASASAEKGLPLTDPAAPPAWSALGGGAGSDANAATISRSTSAGSTTPRSSAGEEIIEGISTRSTPSGASSSAGLTAPGSGRSELPPMQQNIPFVVLNTFINTVPEQDLLAELEGFFEQRRIRSCPASPDMSRSALPEPQAAADSETAADNTAPQTPCLPQVNDAMPRVLRLADTLQDEMFFSSHDLPSVGSKGHYAGLCKPCAFVHTKGCGNGQACEFCHLCDAGARKRRQKERVVRWRDATRSGCHEVAWKSHAGGA